jgi:phospholipid transport system substrate-binding protein
MTNRRTFLALALGALALPKMASVARAAGASPASKSTAAANLGPASQAVRAANERMRQLLAQKAEKASAAEAKLTAKVTAEMRSLLDIDDLTKRALVDHWDKMSASERGDVTTTMRAIIERQYLSDLRQNLDYDVDYRGDDPVDSGARVKTVIKAKQNNRPVKIKVDYLASAQAQSWRVWDVVTDDVSLVTNYRTQFNKIIAREGVAGLITRMKNKLAKPA